MLAEKGYLVEIFDREAGILQRASLNNEGKIHLGYVYGGDQSFETDSRMIDDALSFRPVVERFVSAENFEGCLVDPFQYIIPPSSLLTYEAIRHHFMRVDKEVRRRSQAGDRRYVSNTDPFDCVFGEAEDGSGSAIVETQECAVWPAGIAALLTEAVMAHPRIGVRPRTQVREVRRAGSGWMLINEAPASGDGPFNVVVNAAWAGRRQIDAVSGHPCGETWLTRYKFGIVLERAREMFGGELPVNGTGTSGPFGDSVYYPQNDTLYCCWYPVGCCFSTTSEFSLDPPDFTESVKSLSEKTWAGYAGLDPAYRKLLTGAQEYSCHLVGDYIMAKGDTDISDRESGLHYRFDHRPQQLAPGYWSVETGKYVSAPRLADQLVRAIVGAA
jgi:hypothetical protein